VLTLLCVEVVYWDRLLDEKAIAMFEEKVGAGKFAEMKAMLADGKMSKEEIAKVAIEAGVPEMMVSMIVKFI
jgi:hypothetical protein